MKKILYMLLAVCLTTVVAQAAEPVWNGAGLTVSSLDGEGHLRGTVTYYTISPYLSEGTRYVDAASTNVNGYMQYATDGTALTAQWALVGNASDGYYMKNRATGAYISMNKSGVTDLESLDLSTQNALSLTETPSDETSRFGIAEAMYPGQVVIGLKSMNCNLVWANSSSTIRGYYSSVGWGWYGHEHNAEDAIGNENTMFTMTPVETVFEVNKLTLASEITEGMQVSLQNVSNGFMSYIDVTRHRLSAKSGRVADGLISLLLIGDNETGFLLWNDATKRYVGPLNGGNEEIHLVATAAEAGIYTFQESAAGFKIRCVNASNIAYEYMGGTAGELEGVVIGVKEDVVSSEWEIYSMGQAVSSTLSAALSITMENIQAQTTYDEGVLNGVPGMAKAGSSHPVALFVAEKTLHNWKVMQDFFHANSALTMRDYENLGQWPVNLPVAGKTYRIRATFSDGSPDRYLVFNEEEEFIDTSVEKPTMKNGRWLMKEYGAICNAVATSTEEHYYISTYRFGLDISLESPEMFNILGGVRYGALSISADNIVYGVNTNGSLTRGNMDAAYNTYSDKFGTWSTDFIFEEVHATTAAFTYDLKFNNEVVKQITVPAANIDQDMPTFDDMLPYGVQAAWPQGQVSAAMDGSVIEVECSLIPEVNEIVWSTDANDIQWQSICMRGGVVYANNQERATSGHRPVDYLNYYEYEWGFIGTPFGFRLVNRGMGTDLYLADTGFNDEGVLFQVTGVTSETQNYGKFALQKITDGISIVAFNSTEARNGYQVWFTEVPSGLANEGVQTHVCAADEALLEYLKQTVEVDFPDDVEQIEGMTTCEEISNAFTVPVIYHMVGSWDIADEYTLGTVVIRRPIHSDPSQAAFPAHTYYSYSHIRMLGDETLDADHREFTVIYTPNFPFTQGKVYTLRSDDGEMNNYVCDGQRVWYDNSEPLSNSNDKWVFVHVPYTRNLFMVRSVRYLSYLTISGVGDNVATMEGTATPWTSGTGKTSMFRVVPNKSGFNLEHPGDAETCVGAYMYNSVGTKKAADSETSDASRHFVEECAIDYSESAMVAEGTFTLGAGYTTDNLVRMAYFSEEGNLVLVEDAEDAKSPAACDDLDTNKYFFKVTSTGSYTIFKGELFPTYLIQPVGDSQKRYVTYVPALDEEQPLGEITLDTDPIYGKWIFYHNGEVEDETQGVRGYHILLSEPMDNGIYLSWNVDNTIGSIVPDDANTYDDPQGNWALSYVSNIWQGDNGNFGTINFATPVVVPANVMAYVLDSAYEGHLTFKLTYTQGDVIPAETPVILYTDDEIVHVGSKYYRFAPTVEAGTDPEINLFGGTLAATVFDTDVYVLDADSQNRNVFMRSKYRNVNANKAYISGQYVAAGVRSYVIDLKDFWKAEGIHGATTTAPSYLIYDLQGRRLEKAARGLYIVNGQKAISK